MSSKSLAAKSDGIGVGYILYWIFVGGYCLLKYVAFGLQDVVGSGKPLLYALGAATIGGVILVYALEQRRKSGARNVIDWIFDLAILVGFVYSIGTYNNWF